MTLGVVALLSVGCASNHASSRADSSSVLSTARLAADDGRVSGNQGQVASMWGDTHTSTLLFERAVAANPTPLNKFNLAGAYQNEGRQGDALLLYDQVVKEGKDAQATTVSPADRRGQRNVGFNLAAAASERRIVTLDRLRQSPTAATGEAVNTSTSPDTPSMIAAEAAALDARENPL